MPRLSIVCYFKFVFENSNLVLATFGSSVATFSGWSNSVYGKIGRALQLIQAPLNRCPFFDDFYLDRGNKAYCMGNVGAGLPGDQSVITVNL